ncbi:Extracellular solute-binding protein family 3 [Desulfamplus magnetovallimortis]|uniref:Extracellular solute-binding protein family 3 n=1 Tax=Desulfamplus magnetovallimortis TaxID=1246637 RepID=A0A1W1HJK8_9BACT|nr:transporter substrate-binding domain-containing protein [Desulfamplus magnetovallimortis]SLM32548.1 Extracellular solute-binding protein family 3 [Desulfamplus magnetovallimortis]
MSHKIPELTMQGVSSPKKLGLTQKRFAEAFIFMLAIFLSASVAWSSDIELSEDSTLEGILRRGKIEIGMETGFMPFEMVDKRSGIRQKQISHGGVRRGSTRNVNIIGFDIDMGIEMAKELGVKPVFVDTFWPSIIPALKLGRFDIIFGGMSVTEERKKEVDFADPFMTIGQTVLLNIKHRGKILSYKDLNSASFKVASKPGTTGEQSVMKYIPQCKYISYDTEEEGARAVLEGDVDAFVYDFPYNAVFMTMYGKEKLVFLDKPFTEEPIAWAIRKNDPEFMKFLNDFLKKIKSDGRFDRIYKKWFEDSSWHPYVR